MAGPPAPDRLPAPDDAGDAVAPPPKKGGRLLLVLPLVAAVLGTALGATQRERLAPMLPGVAATDSAAAAEPSGAAVEYGEFHEVQGIIVNPAGSGGRRFLMVNVAFESADAHTLEELQAKEVVVRDAIVALLGRHTAEALGRSTMREALKDSLRTHVNTVLGPAGHVERLYFTQYVLQ